MADNEKPDDLRSLLSASFDEAATASQEPAPIGAGSDAAAADIGAKKGETADKAADAKANDGAPDTKAGERDRGPDGKFLKKDDTEKPAAAAAKDDDKSKAKDAKAEEPKADADKTAADKPAETKPADGKEPPANWSASDKALFKLQSAEAQEFLLRRHKAMESDYTKKVEAVADLKKEFGPIEEMFKPHLEVLKAKGLTPASTIRAWANVETALANGRGIDVVKGMIEGYRIDKAALGKALGFTSTDAATLTTDPKAATNAAGDATNAAHQPIQLPPELTEELRQLRARIDAREASERTAQTSAAQAREAKVETDITNFKSAANDKGELLHPYFEEVEPAMIALASSYVASKQPIPELAELYDTAVWANPSTRAAVLASQKAAEQTRQAEEARAKSASARKAASSVTGAQGSGQATKPIRGEMSLREQLEEAAAETG